MATNEISIVTYNVLCPNLVSAHSTNRDPQYLDENYRLSLLYNQFNSFIENGSIIALQEVSKRWSDKFMVFFTAHDYGFYWAKGEDSRSEYMGPAIAWPLSLIFLEDLESFKVSSLIIPPDTPKEVLTTSQVSKSPTWKDWIVNKMMNYFFGSTIEDKPTPVVDERDMACKKKNEAVIAKFRTFLDYNFTVVNYHMPCAFNYPTVMRLHTEALITLTKSRAGNDPVILLGDFNSTPDSEVYKMITKEFKSIYHHEKEPEFTNKSLFKYENMKSPVEFIGTLDYIFTRRFNVEDKFFIPKVEDLPFIPTKGYPSDHIPIGATLIISKS